MIVLKMSFGRAGKLLSVSLGSKFCQQLGNRRAHCRTFVWGLKRGNIFRRLLTLWPNEGQRAGLKCGWYIEKYVGIAK